MESFLRFVYVAKKLIPLFVVFGITRHNPKSKRFQSTIIKIRLTLQGLGTTYVKVGQLLSARPDIAGSELSAELRKLLDKEPPMSLATIKHILKEELRQDIEHIFKDFDENPVSTASIAQVHKATLKNGQKVAVKIQRLGLDASIPKELTVFKQVAVILDVLIRGKSIRFNYLYSEFSEWIYNELDFTVEGKRAIRFAKNMQGVDGVTVPKIFWEHTTGKVLMMSFIEGITVNYILSQLEQQHVKTISAAKLPYKIDQNVIVRRAVSSLVKQVVIDKFFHGDLHPANIIVQKNNVVSFIDYGIIGSLDNDEHATLMYTIIGFIDEDPQLIVKVLAQSSVKPLSVEQSKTLYQLISKELHMIHENAADKISLSHFLMLILSISYAYDFILSPGMILAAKSFSQLDSVASLIGVDVPIVDLIKPEFEKYFSGTFSSEISKELMYKNFLELADASKRLPETITEFEDVIKNIPRMGGDIVTASGKKKSIYRLIVLALLAIVIALPIIKFPAIAQSSYSNILTLVIPLVLLYILNKIV